MEKDADERANRFGQHMADAFALCDVVIATDTPDDKSQETRSVRRFVELLFGNWTHTPTYDETGMYIAQGSACRSSSMARQVGAAILRPDGSVVALGANEVPKFGGGFYSSDDVAKGVKDGRDHAFFAHDTSDAMRREIVADLIARLGDDGVFEVPDRAKADEIASELLRRETGSVKKALLMNTIDYVRAVHAEAAAIVEAARLGLSTRDCVLYTTTFPCHDCAKHIVAAGVRRVVYIEPYTKSHAVSFYKDSIVVDDPNVGDHVQFLPFVGVAPRRYSELFTMRGERKARGLYKPWDKAKAEPRLPDYAALSASRMFNEQIEIEGFRQGLTQAGIAGTIN
jgi:cytidine deaminase